MQTKTLDEIYAEWRGSKIYQTALAWAPPEIVEIVFMAGVNEGIREYKRLRNALTESETVQCK